MSRLQLGGLSEEDQVSLVIFLPCLTCHVKFREATSPTHDARHPTCRSAHDEAERELRCTLARHASPDLYDGHCRSSHRAALLWCARERGVWDREPRGRLAAGLLVHSV